MDIDPLTCSLHLIPLSLGIARYIYGYPDPEDEKVDSIYPYHGIYVNVGLNPVEGNRAEIVWVCPKCKQKAINLIKIKKDLKKRIGNLKDKLKKSGR